MPFITYHSFLGNIINSTPELQLPPLVICLYSIVNNCMEQNFLRIVVEKMHPVTHPLQFNLAGTMIASSLTHKEQQHKRGSMLGWFGLKNYTKLS